MRVSISPFVSSVSSGVYLAQNRLSNIIRVEKLRDSEPPKVTLIFFFIDHLSDELCFKYGLFRIAIYLCDVCGCVVTGPELPVHMWGYLK